MPDKLSDKAEVAKALGLNKIVPEIYEDLLQPATKEIGKGLEVTAKTINLALAPLQGLVWGSEKIKDYLTISLTERLKDVPPNNIINPKPNVAGPAIESLKFCGHETELRELFVNLLATSINKITSTNAHPAFIEVIKQITPDEARILKHFSTISSFPLIERKEVTLSWWPSQANEEVVSDFVYDCKKIKLNQPELIHSYLDNLRRLQLVEITHEYKDGLQDQLTKFVMDIDELQELLLQDKERVEKLFFTKFGEQFIETCIKNEQQTNDNNG